MSLEKFKQIREQQKADREWRRNMVTTLQIKRTCTSCGTSWFVSQKEADERPVTNMQIAMRKRQGLTGLKTKKKQMLALEMKQDQERVKSYSQCPSCRSTSFTTSYITGGSVPPTLPAPPMQ